MTSPTWLVPALSESIRLAIHAQLEELIAGSERCPYVLTEEGERAADCAAAESAREEMAR